ncbi:MAG TPA: RCC1 domain-containing protein [Myxococcales bacterium LLY-WYZ-16_1]|nr:RCC1 domain-containing protein [Myxococcales bacterium LLY-WYZ-16_1]
MGSRNGCGVREDGTIVCWGRIGLTTTPPEGQFKWVAVDLGACAVTIDDRVVCWAEEDEELAEIMPPEDLRP